MPCQYYLFFLSFYFFWKPGVIRGIGKTKVVYNFIYLSAFILPYINEDDNILSYFLSLMGELYILAMINDQLYLKIIL